MFDKTNLDRALRNFAVARDVKEIMVGRDCDSFEEAQHMVEKDNLVAIKDENGTFAFSPNIPTLRWLMFLLDVDMENVLPGEFRQDIEETLLVQMGFHSYKDDEKQEIWFTKSCSMFLGEDDYQRLEKLKRLDDQNENRRRVVEAAFDKRLSCLRYYHGSGKSWTGRVKCPLTDMLIIWARHGVDRDLGHFYGFPMVQAETLRICNERGWDGRYSKRNGKEVIKPLVAV